MGKADNLGNFTSGFRKCRLKPYNPDILANHIFECNLILAVNGEDTIGFAEETLDISAPNSYCWGTIAYSNG
jgi:hypothetical protein